MSELRYLKVQCYADNLSSQYMPARGVALLEEFCQAGSMNAGSILGPVMLQDSPCGRTGIPAAHQHTCRYHIQAYIWRQGHL